MTPQRKTPLQTSPKPRRHIKWRTQVLAYLFLLPALLIFTLVTWRPILTTVIYSFQKVGLTGFQGWVGFHNYVRMFGNPLFYIAWKNILYFVILSIILGFAVPIVVALMMGEMRRLIPVFRTIVYIPALIPIAIALLVWRHIYAPEGGILNSLLGLVGIAPQLWLQDPRLARQAMIVILTWLGAGGSALIYMAALQEIPRELYEAAEIDGVSPWQRVWHITLPLIAARMEIMLVLQILSVAQIFAPPFILTSGGPANTTMTPVLEIYRTAFDRNDFGLASAWSVSMLVILSILSVIYVWLSTRREEAGRV